MHEQPATHPAGFIGGLSAGSEEIVATRGEAIDQLTLFQTQAAMLDMAGNDEAIAFLKIIGFAVAVKAEAAAGDVGGLHMRMAVQLAFGAGLEAEGDHHQFRRFGKHGALHAIVGGNGGEGGKLLHIVLLSHAIRF
ncbi:hypothetical protein AGR9A_Lc80002 [Agrobacterium salinitolerans str. Hayward 0363]|nr:hypothetical protein AGR9A_Lc80002 [Agrobacterium salinitolerans str. Hayward 0363]